MNNPYDPNNPNRFMGNQQAGYGQQSLEQPTVNPYQGSTQQAINTMPQLSYHQVDEATQAQAYKEAKARMQQGTNAVYLKFPGPNGAKWTENVPIGFESVVPVYIAPPWKAGRNIFRVYHSHFWKSIANPAGISISCLGSECLLCKASAEALNGQDAMLQKKAKDFGRVRVQYLYNVFVLDNLPLHLQADGTQRPIILAATATLHTAIGELIDGRGGTMNIVDPMRGRPIRLKRRKDGPLPLDIKYSALDLDPIPLPQEFYPAFQNLWDLDEIVRPPTQEDMLKAVVDLGLPIPNSIPTAQQPMQQSNNPYQLTTPTHPYENREVSNPQPVVPQPVVSSSQVNTVYSPQPGMQTREMNPMKLTIPLNPSVWLPDGREKCFGKFTVDSNICAECPKWILSQCMEQSVAQRSPVTSDGQATLTDVKNQIVGK